MRTEVNCAALLPQVLSLVREAGRSIVVCYRNREQGLRYKTDGTPVTDADLASHRILEEGLGDLPCQWAVVSEESAPIPWCELQSWRSFWLIDPLDGTHEFLRGSGEFTVNVALIVGDAPVLGVVYAPAFDKLYFAVRKTGSYRMEGDVATAIKVGPAKTLAETRLVMSRGHASERDSMFAHRNHGENPILRMGSSLKFCLVAEGAADVYPRSGPTMEWDTAAGQCILEEAGGSVVDLEGNPLRYNKADLRNTGFLARAHPEFASEHDLIDR